MQGGGAWRPMPPAGLLVLGLCLLAVAVAHATTPSPTVPAQQATAADFVHDLEAKTRRILTHLRTDQSLGPAEAADRDRVAGILERALAGKEGLFRHALGLHRALWAAQGFLLRRTKELAKEHEHLSLEVSEQQAHILYTMLKQRRTLPMKTQVVMLRRPQFSNCTYAQQLLARHSDGRPLYQQLEALLPPWLLQELTGRRPGAREHLAAAGSGGRVHIVSSRLKNNVKQMERELRRAKDQISKLLAGNSMREVERKQAQQILAGLDEVLGKASRTNDLKVQLEAMDEMRDKLASWMKNFQA